MNTFKPGTPVWHPKEKLHGLAFLSSMDAPRIMITGPGGHGETVFNHDGWERARTAGPGEVVVKVDDLDLAYWAGRDQYAPGVFDGGRLAIRAANAWAELQANVSETPADLQRETDAESELAESSQKDEQPMRVKDKDGDVWERQDNGIYEIPSKPYLPKCNYERLDKACGPLTVLDDEPEPAQDSEAVISGMVSMPCPWCGEDVTATGAIVDTGADYKIILDAFQHGHTCEPAQPDEPQEFGAMVTVTKPDGTRERFLRDRTDNTPPWIVDLAAYGQHGVFRWKEILERGTVALGWGE